MYPCWVLPDLSFHVVGVSHHTAPLGVRERFAFSPAELALLLKREAAENRAALLLSTCNRCELYWTGDQDSESWFREFARDRGVTEEDAITGLDGLGAVRHLFTVAAGLDSQIVGEAEILRQVAILVQPYMPVSAGKLLDLLSVPADARDFAALGSAGRLVSGTSLPPPTAIFPRHVEETETSAPA